MDSPSYWIENLRRYSTVRELRRSDFFARCGKDIEKYLATPQIFFHAKAVPRLNSFLRVVQWNIEKGKRFEAALDLLKNNEILKWADIILLNEADHGMNRSQNRHVAESLARELGMHAVFAPAYFELTKGTDDELYLHGENRESLQGNAILSRPPILDVRIIPLPATFEPYEFAEKRYGRRNCLWARLKLKNGSLWAGVAHLELRNTPGCRARQMMHIMRELPDGESEPCVLGGDLNTNSFSRGTAPRAVKSMLRLLFTPSSTIENRLLHPECGTEPLFNVLNRYGFSWDSFNSSQETARTAIDSLEEAAFFPEAVLKLIYRRLRPYRGYLSFKLDWLLGKCVRALTEEQKRDTKTGVESIKPGRLDGENSGRGRISDHLPIYADFDLS